MRQVFWILVVPESCCVLKPKFCVTVYLQEWIQMYLVLLLKRGLCALRTEGRSALPDAALQIVLFTCDPKIKQQFSLKLLWNRVQAFKKFGIFFWCFYCEYFVLLHDCSKFAIVKEKKKQVENIVVVFAQESIGVSISVLFL